MCHSSEEKDILEMWANAQRDSRSEKIAFKATGSLLKFIVGPMLWYDMMDYINVRPKADV